MGRPNKRPNQKTAPTNYKKLAQKQQRAAEAELEDELKLTIHLQFTAMDTWFFRESRPHDAVGASELSSLFPPPVRTLIGAVRSFLGEQIGIYWQAFNSGNAHADFKQVVGDGEKLGNLSVRGAWVCQNEQRLYPAPYYLMHKETDFTRLHIGSIVDCDLGSVRLPELPKDKAGYKGVEQKWITSAGWQKLLNGDTPAMDDVIKADVLFSKEARLGIARDNASRSVIESRLYQTQHVRLKDNASVQMDVKGLSEELVKKLPAKHAILRLGGEGRMATLENKSHCLPLPRLLTPLQSLKKIIIHFVTAAYFGEQDFKGQLFPENFVAETDNGQTIWQGEIEGIKLIVEAAVIGKVHREGGWDMQNHQPRAVKSYLPAGTAWFCRVVTKISAKDLLDKLNGQCIGNETQWGRGQILIGVWNDNKTEGK